MGRYLIKLLNRKTFTSCQPLTFAFKIKCYASCVSKIKLGWFRNFKKIVNHKWNHVYIPSLILTFIFLKIGFLNFNLNPCEIRMTYSQNGKRETWKEAKIGVRIAILSLCFMWCMFGSFAFPFASFWNHDTPTCLYYYISLI